MMSLAVFVYLPEQSAGSPAGHLACFEDHAVFTYDLDFLDKACALPIDPVHFPLDDSPVTLSASRMGALRDASPDYWGRCALEAVRPQPGRTEWATLAEPSAWRIGTLEVGRQENRQALRLSHLEDILCLAECVEQEAPVPEHGLGSLFVSGSCIGGARPKVSLVDDGTAWIAKLPSVYDTWDQARIEMATMRLAEKCGIRVPKMRLCTGSSRGSVLLVQRFDRTLTETGMLRRAYFSGLTLLGCEELDRDAYSYATLAKNMCALGMRDDCTELFRRICFNIVCRNTDDHPRNHIVCRNTDDHPRNHGFIRTDTGYRLSPAFDLTPTKAVQGLSTDVFLAMAVGDGGRLASLDNAVSAHGVYGLSQEEAAGVATDIVAVCLAEWERCFEACGVSSADKKAFAWTFERWREV